MGKADRNKSNSITAQWGIPTILLMIFMVITLINYNKTMQENSKAKALDRVSRQAVSVAGYYKGLYEGTANAADAVSDYLMTEENIFGDRAVEILKQFDSHVGLVEAYIVKPNGNAIDSYGKRHDVVDTSDAFKSLLGTKDSAISLIDEKNRPVLMVSAPIRSEEEVRGNLILVYKADRIAKQMDSTAYSYSLVYAEGIVGEVYGA
ncbi:MAG: cache domain-containing protein, partial [Lachnospiraceae bacterium]|nr:cache domain-containing protein [Lachnospiraceae bacterium]